MSIVTHKMHHSLAYQVIIPSPAPEVRVARRHLAQVLGNCFMFVINPRRMRRRVTVLGLSDRVPSCMF